MDKKEVRIYKRWLIGLGGCFIVAAGAAASSFYLYYQETTRQIAKMSASVEALQEQVETLSTENEELLAENELVSVMAEDGTISKHEKIPFEVDLEDWKYLLVNELNLLSSDFEPQLARTKNGQKVDYRIKEDLEEMIAAAREDKLYLMICSSYRDYKKQDSLMDESIAKYVRAGMTYEEAFFKTKEQIAMTGASEHHTGLAVDIVGSRHQSLDSSQADTAEAKWLAEHAHEYGFILRFPEDKEEITMISFESWHYRYVGKEAAAYMKENNLCLEEFLELAQAQQRQTELRSSQMD